MYKKLSKDWRWWGNFCAAVLVVAAIMLATAALRAEGTKDQADKGQTSVAQRISDLTAFINEGNIVLFHNELMDSQREADDPRSDPKKLVKFIIDIWEQNKASLPNLNWQNAVKDEFRVSVAAIITLGIRDGWIDYDQEEINRFFRDRVTANNSHVWTMAILYLAVGGNDEDAALFKRLSLSGTERVSRMAIRALGMLCSLAGKAALTQLESELSDADRRAMVAENLRLYYGDGPVKRCHSY